MSQFIESIRLQDDQFKNLFYHEQRMNHTLKNRCGITETFNLEAMLANIDRPRKGLYKCRIIYDDQSREIEFIPYKPKPVETLRIIEHDRINYEFKYADRKLINHLYDLRRGCDDILVVKRGLVTDSSYANIAFRKGKDWYTPWSALLKGTMRANLMQHDKIKEEEIRVADIKTFDSFKLINAMFEFDAPEIAVSNIVY